jgi:hypothetical protein
LDWYGDLLAVTGENNALGVGGPLNPLLVEFVFNLLGRVPDFVFVESQ